MIYFIIASIVINYIVTFFILRDGYNRGLDITLSDLIWGSLFSSIPLFTIGMCLLFSCDITIIKGKHK